MIDYTPIDQSFILRFIFFPRRDVTPCPDHAFDLFVLVDDTVSISCRFYSGHPEWPWILYFHGNGEVVSDYDGVALVYHEKRLNLVVADYRGYGGSTGVPTLTALVRDSHVIFREVKRELSKRDFKDDLWVMGRSLGSISALELAYHYPEEIKGLVIESGFSSAVRIIKHLGIPTYGIPLDRIDQECVKRIEKIFIPTLILHGEDDTLVPLREAEALYHHLGTDQKELIVIPSATHNDIMYVGFRTYFEALQRFVLITEKRKSKP